MRCTVIATVLAVLAVTHRAGASPEDIFSYGPRSPAMGGTGAAHSEGFEAAYTNPALLSRLRDKKLTLGFQGGTFDLRATGEGLPGRVSYPGVRGIVIGADVPFALGGALRDRIGGALAFYTPTDIIVRGKLLYPEQPQFPLLPDRAQSLMIRMGLGVDIGYGLRIGAGYAALAEVAGTVIVATDATGRVGSRVEDQLVATYAPTVGVTYDLPIASRETTRIGLVFRGTLDARFAVEIDATKLSTLNIPVFNIAGLAQYDPAQVALEIAHTARAWTVAAGLTYKRWSAYPGPIEPTILCPADTPDCGALTPAAIAYDDTIVARVGGERAFEAARGLTLRLRAGAFYEPDPLPRDVPSSRAFDRGAGRTVDVPTRYLSAARAALTLGYGVEMRDPLPPVAIDLYAQAHLLVPHTVTSNAPDGPGGPVSSRARVSGSVVTFGLLAGVRF
jgi:long-subunit fatty acid transport protein